MEHNPSGKKTPPYVKRRCPRCHGTGRAPCQFCSGSGQTVKGRDAFGKAIYDRCVGCFGTKVRRCATCGGEGFY
jgi:DnaJ-class molecular chaperone